MNELDSLRQEAETLKNAIRVRFPLFLNRHQVFAIIIWLCFIKT